MFNTFAVRKLFGYPSISNFRALVCVSVFPNRGHINVLQRTTNKFNIHPTLNSILHVL